MKTIHTGILYMIMTFSSVMVVAESDHAAHHAAEAAKQVEKPAAMPMKHDMTDMKKMDMKDISPDQCKKMMQAHHAGMKMDTKMMENMKHCEMMSGNK